MTALIVLAPAAAHAELDVAHSGNTGSDSNAFYLSTNVRTVTTDLYPYAGFLVGYVYINIDVTPKFSNGNPDALKWRVRYLTLQNTFEYTPITYLYQDPAAWINLGYVGQPGTPFRNSFTRANNCANCNHFFSGNMNY